MAKKLKFDLTNSSTSNPVDSVEIYSEALIKGGSKESFEKILDVKDRARIRKHDFGNVLQADGCQFNAQGAGELKEKFVDACPIKVNVEICQETLETSFVANQMKSGSNNADFLPADFQRYVASQLAKKMAADFEVLVWQGDTGSAVYPMALCDGLLVKFADSGSGVIPAPTGGTIDATNVIAALQEVYDTLPEEIVFSPDLVLYVSTNVLQAYKQATAAVSAEVYFVKDAEPSFLGIPMQLAQGLPASHIVAAEKTNLFLVTDLMSDYEEVRILPQLNTSGDNTVRIVGRVKFAVDFAKGGEIVYWS
jgi:hypothetical protein